MWTSNPVRQPCNRVVCAATAAYRRTDDNQLIKVVTPSRTNKISSMANGETVLLDRPSRQSHQRPTTYGHSPLTQGHEQVRP